MEKRYGKEKEQRDNQKLHSGFIKPRKTPWKKSYRKERNKKEKKCTVVSKRLGNYREQRYRKKKKRKGRDKEKKKSTVVS